MEVFEEFPEVYRVRVATADKMVVIGQHCPCLDLPMIILSQNQQLDFQQFQPRLAAKQMRFVQGSRRHEVHAILAQLVDRRVRPWSF